MIPTSIYETDFEKLRKIGQSHLLENQIELDSSQKQKLFHQIQSLNTDFFFHLKKILLESKTPKIFEPLCDFSFDDADPVHRLTGTRLLEGKKVACVVLAGGQGSRLKYNAPKGFFPVSPVKKKTLFQLIAEKTKSASKLVQQDLPLAFMISPLNADKTLSYFKSNKYFGLNPAQVDFFQQPLWPLFDPNGNLFLEECDKIAFGPNGNGCLARSLFQSPIWEKWNAMGIEMVSIIPIDNPLALPFDVGLFGFHKTHNNDVTIKASLRESPDENVGILARESSTGKTIVVEYSEISDEQRFSVNQDGTLTYPLANIGLYCLSMDFIKKVHNVTLPIYKNKKMAKTWNPSLKKGRYLHADAWKFEEFIFDLFAFAKSCGTLVYPRDECFAPLKNSKGSNSLMTVHEALSQRERRIFKNLTGVELAPNANVELDSDFYYPSQNNSSRQWQKKTFFEGSFIEAL